MAHCCGELSSSSDNQAYQLDQCPAYGKMDKPTGIGGHSRPSEEYQLDQCPAYGETAINPTAQNEYEPVYYTVCQ